MSEICVQKQKLSPLQLSCSSCLHLFMVPHSIFHAVVVVMINQDSPAWTSSNTDRKLIHGWIQGQILRLSERHFRVQEVHWSMELPVKKDLWNELVTLSFPLVAWEASPTLEMALGPVFHVWIRSYCPYFSWGSVTGWSFPSKMCSLQERKPRNVVISRALFPIKWGCCYLGKLERFILLYFSMGRNSCKHRRLFHWNKTLQNFLLEKEILKVNFQQSSG